MNMQMAMAQNMRNQRAMAASKGGQMMGAGQNPGANLMVKGPGVMKSSASDGNLAGAAAAGSGQGSPAGQPGAAGGAAAQANPGASMAVGGGGQTDAFAAPRGW